MSVPTQARDKLAWALGRLSADFEAVIEGNRFGDYQIAFSKGDRRIPKTIDKGAVDDCYPPGNHIPEALVHLIEAVRAEFSATSSGPARMLQTIAAWASILSFIITVIVMVGERGLAMVGSWVANHLAVLGLVLIFLVSTAIWLRETYRRWAETRAAERQAFAALQRYVMFDDPHYNERNFGSLEEKISARITRGVTTGLATEHKDRIEADTAILNRLAELTTHVTALEQRPR